MIANSQNFGSGAKGALIEYTSAMFGFKPKGYDAFFEHADTLVRTLGKVEA